MAAGEAQMAAAAPRLIPTFTITGNSVAISSTPRPVAEETASESPAPGGGSISAYMGALGAALGTMVANLSSHKPGWDARWEEFSDWADKGV